MKNFIYIQGKLQSFIGKFYLNEIIKGSILFLTFGLLYFIFTLFIEYFLWLKPLARTILFWVFIWVEFGLLLKLILVPILKLIGLQKGISLNDASKIIGDHFGEVDDKLLNILQLNESETQTDLLLASIEQKSQGLSPVPFKKAINFKSNSKYFKYLAIPILIWILIYFTGNISVFTNSLDRVVHHQMTYAPPAPFKYKILNDKMESIEGESFKLLITTIGDIIPEDIKINYNDESYYLNSMNTGTFFYEFENLDKSFDFYLEANNIESVPYRIEVVKTPKIIDFKMELSFPDYIHKENEVIKNTGNARVPVGTKVTWNISSQNANKISFISNSKTNQSLELIDDDFYNLTKVITKNIDYQITTSNQKLKNYEQLNYRLQAVKDEFPKIIIKSDIDSVARGPVQFAGQLSDDYGISKLQMIAKNLSDNSNNLLSIDIGDSDFEEFFYVFPKGIILEDGVSYEIYFEVFDNDGINGRKRTKSNSFYYRNKTEQEVEEELLDEQKQSLEDIKNSSNNSKEIQKSLEELSDKLKSKKGTDWNDKKQIEEFFERQKKYREIMEKNTDKLLDNLEEMDHDNEPSLEEKNKELKRRIEETKELEQKKELLKELEELADKLQREDLLDKIDKLKEQSKQENKSLERILELTKRFYVEKKSAQIMRKIDSLSKEQEKLSESLENSSEQQDGLNKKFESIKKEFNELEKYNEELKSPMNLPDTKDEQMSIQDEMNDAKENLIEDEKDPEKSNSNKKQDAQKNQKSAAKKMKALSKKMEAQMMQMEMEGSEENIKDLQQILDNLLIFSFDQEKLMESFENKDSKNSDYPKKLRHQQVLKEYFEHIDDSLYTLSLRMVRLSSKIQRHLTDAHYNLDKSLDNISENRIQEGISNQQYTMTAANDLADLLSDMLQNLKNNNPGNGSGKGKKGESVSLPDIIKKQEKLIKNLQEGTKPGKEKGSRSQEQMNGEQYEIYKQQNELKELLKSLIENNSKRGNEGKEALRQMEELESMLLKKGSSKRVMERMQNLMQELLKLEDASFERNKRRERQSHTNKIEYNKGFVPSVGWEQLYINQDEILIRNKLPLQPVYKKKVKAYFKNEK